jgi:hypothetical protein
MGWTKCLRSASTNPETVNAFAAPATNMNVPNSRANIKSQTAIKHDICSASLGHHLYTVSSAILLKAGKTNYAGHFLFDPLSPRASS